MEKIHKVACGGTGYVCLDANATWYVDLESFGKPETRERIFAEWDKEHNAKHEMATQEDIDKYESLHNE